MKKRALLLLVAGLALGLLSSCAIWDMIMGGGGITISGTISRDSTVSTPPAGAQILVGIVNYVPDVSNEMSSLSLDWDASIGNNPQTIPYGLQVAYEFTGVDKGRYLLVAWIDLNSNGSWEIDEASGTFPTWADSAPQLRDFQSSVTNANITLFPMAGGSSAVFISGSITAGSGVTVATGSELLVGLFDVDPESAGATWSTAFTPNPVVLSWAGGTSMGYSVPNVPSGDYMVVAWVDLDHDDAFDDNEPSGTYPEWTVPPVLQSFTSSVSNANITLYLNPLSAPTTPFPTDNATGVDPMIVKLDWDDCTSTVVGATVTYDIFVAETAVPPTKYNVTPLPTSEWPIPAAFLGASKTYKWKVVAHDSASNIKEGPVWTFTTGAAAAPFTLPSGILVKKGILLTNPDQPAQMSFIYIDTTRDLYSMRSTDGGAIWGTAGRATTTMDIFDMVAAMDGSSTILATVVRGSGIDGTGAEAGWMKLATGGVWSGPTPIYTAAPTEVCRLPSVFRAGPQAILFGVGYDVNGGAPDGAGAKSVHWNGTSMTTAADVGLSTQTDNAVYASQVFCEPGGAMLYLSHDNHIAGYIRALFAISGSNYTTWNGSGTETVLVTATMTTSVTEAYMFKVPAGEYILVYAVRDDAGATHVAYVQHGSTLATLTASTPVRVNAIGTNLRDVDYGNALYHTMYATQDPSGAVHVAWEERETVGKIGRARVDPVTYAAVTATGWSATGSLDGVSSLSGALFVSFHDTAMAANVVRVVNP